MALRREAEALRACAGEGVPALLGEGTLPDGSPYVAMERVRGESLAQYVGRRGKIEPVAAVTLVQRVAGILGRIHAAGYVHCDLKPDHIFVAAGFGGTLDVHVVDFGAAQRIGERSPTPGFVVGTPQYMAPEQAAAVDDLDARADVYALGAILYELLARRPLLSGSNAFTMIARLLSETPPRLALVAPELSLALDRVVGSAIEREREHRCRTALAFAIALVPHARDRIDAERRLAAALRPRSARERERVAMSR
jgi:serine/threonine protein kinase